MEVSDSEVRALTDDADDAHHAGLATMTEELAAEVAAQHRALDPALGRRAVLRRVLSGAAVTLGAVSLPLVALFDATADAQGGGAPPPALDLARFTASIELAAAGVYDGAVARELLSAPAAELCRRFAGHHRDHAGAFNALLPPEHRITAANRVALGTFAPQVQAIDDSNRLLRLLLGLEEAAVATYLAAISTEAPAGEIAAIAAIAPVEAQHAVAIATMVGARDDALRPFERAEGAMTLAGFPIGPP